MPKKLSRMNDTEIVQVARRMFLFGLPCLPFCWFVASIWLFKASRERSHLSDLRRYHLYCMIGSIVWFILVLTWYILFLHYRLDSLTLESLTVVLVKGE
jgi:hypothetical protein